MRDAVPEGTFSYCYSPNTRRLAMRIESGHWRRGLAKRVVYQVLLVTRLPVAQITMPGGHDDPDARLLDVVFFV